MTWTTPTPPVSGTVITVPWAETYVIDNSNHLRGMLPDPGAAGKVHLSTGADTAGWFDAAPDSDLLDGKAAGNASGNIPVSNTTMCVDLNAEFLGGYRVSDITAGAVPAGTSPYWRGTNASIPSGWADITGVGYNPSFAGRTVRVAHAGLAYNTLGGSDTVNILHSHNFFGGHSGSITIDNNTDGDTEKVWSSGDSERTFANDTHGHTGSVNINNHNSATEPNLSTTQSVQNLYGAMPMMVKV